MTNYAPLDAAMRKEYIDSAVKAAALIEYKLKTLCTVESADAWTLTYWQRVNTVEAAGAGTGSNVAGVPQMAPYPYIEQPLTKVSTVIKKFAAESILSIENIDTAPVSVLALYVQTVTRTVSYALDVAIEAVMSGSAGNTFALTAGYEWDSATVSNRDPMGDILNAIQYLRADGIDALKGNGYFVTNGTDATNILKNSKIINNPTFTSKVSDNGIIGSLCGLKWMISEAVTADQAYVIVANEALTFKQVEALQTAIIEDPGKSKLIRAWEIGSIQIPVPNAVCKITNTRA
jgi:hypothetical protein